MQDEVNRLIPELKLEKLHDVVRDNILMANLNEDQARDIVNICLNKFWLFFKQAYGEQESKKDEDLVITIWCSALCDLTTRQVFGGLLECIQGKSKYGDKAPPNPVAFHLLCKSSRFPGSYFEPLAQIEELPALENTSKRERSVAIEASAMSKIRDILKTTKRTPYLPNIKTFTQVSAEIVGKADEVRSAIFEDKPVARSVSGIPGL